MTQNDLADLIGVNRATLSKYENGQIIPSISQLRKICTVLNCHLFDLMTEDEMQNMLGRVVSVDIPAISDKLLQSYLATEGKNKFSIPPADQHRLQDAFRKLNAKGQRIAVERVEELTLIAEYTATESTETPLQSFAGDGQGNSSIKQEKPPEG